MERDQEKDRELFIEKDEQIVEEKNYKIESPYKIVFRRFFKDKLAITGMIMLIMVLALILIGPLFTKDASTINIVMKNMPPSSNNILGTDALGRDFLARV